MQAFPQFETDQLHHTLHSVRDAFAINYGTGGAGAEILANRVGVGPARDCAECKYEEFFLSSWALGDPAMVVDVPANAPCTKAQIEAGNTSCYTVGAARPPRPSIPDDPSNVYHSYLSDHVKFRNVHAGSDDHHIFHLHAHQWLHSPRQRQVVLPRQPVHRPGRRLHLRDRLRRQRQPQQDGGRLDLPLPLLSPLRPGHVERSGGCTTCSSWAPGSTPDGTSGRGLAGAARQRDPRRHADPGRRADPRPADGAAARPGADRSARPGRCCRPPVTTNPGLSVLHPRHRRPPAAASAPGLRRQSRRRPSWTAACRATSWSPARRSSYRDPLQLRQDAHRRRASSG